MFSHKFPCWKNCHIQNKWPFLKLTCNTLKWPHSKINCHIINWFNNKLLPVSKHVVVTNLPQLAWQQVATARHPPFQSLSPSQSFSWANRRFGPCLCRGLKPGRKWVVLRCLRSWTLFGPWIPGQIRLGTLCVPMHIVFAATHTDSPVHTENINFLVNYGGNPSLSKAVLVIFFGI